MNQTGQSWPETILTLAVLLVIFGTLLPLATKMTTTLHEKKLAMHAAETAYYGAIMHRAYAENNGTRKIDGMDYDWYVADGDICISYERADGVKTKCVEY